MSATIDQVGASLNSARVGDVAIVPEWADGVTRPFSSGVTLAPWPNRVRDGLWEWQGQQLQLAITEPARNTALHGLVTETVWEVASRSDDAVTLTTSIDPSPGYPFELALSLTYSLTPDGITCDTSVSNVGQIDAPVALGTHPFVCVGSEGIRTMALTSPVAERVAVDDRLLPIGMEAVEGTSFDFSQGVPISDLELDTAFRLGGEAPFVTSLHSPSGQRVEVWQSSECEWIQFFITDSFPGPTGPQGAIAIEPMTAPPDALRSGTSLKVLAPGETWSISWGVRLT